jgi:ABC-type molybdate transport system substrate-binding protein
MYRKIKAFAALAVALLVFVSLSGGCLAETGVELNVFAAAADRIPDPDRRIVFGGPAGCTAGLQL